MGHKEWCQYALEFVNPQLILSGKETLQGKSTISEVTYSQKSYINTGECESVLYLNYRGDRADGRNSPAAAELQTSYREMGRILHTDFVCHAQLWSLVIYI